ncbi:MAG: hypothetical protein LUD47_02785 [Clostridia bacterium]|nr:hypothetical protein [Clostridia bacterium]
MNLTLDVLGTESGYHMIDSLVTTIDLCDGVRVKKRRDELINVHMRGLGSEWIPREDNNACTAAEMFRNRFDTGGMDIFIDKNIPIGAGLGGSSADAAAVLSALPILYETGEFGEIKEIADVCGSDTGYLLTGGYAEITGRGDTVRVIDSDMRLDILLVVPKGRIITAKCYETYDGLNVRSHHTTAETLDALKRGDAAALGRSLSNGLVPAAVTMSKDIADIYNELLSFSPLGVNMTGSGSCVYAICENDMFCRYMKSRIRGPYSVIQAKTLRPKPMKTGTEDLR